MRNVSRVLERVVSMDSKPPIERCDRSGSLEVSMMEYRMVRLYCMMSYAQFVAYDILEGHSRVLDGALAQVDLASVPVASPLRKQRAFSPGQLDRYLN